MAIVIHRPLHLFRLRFPGILHVNVSNGLVYLRGQGACKKVASGESFLVPAFLRFDCDVVAGPNRPASFSFSTESDAPLPLAANGDNKNWSRQIAHTIFMSPKSNWSVSEVARCWHVTSQKVRSRLFAEGEALSSLVREQRVAHTLCALTGMNRAPADQLLAKSGFSSMAALSAACMETVGVSVETLLSRCPDE